MSEWISIKDRMPDNGIDEFLITDGHGRYDIAVLMDAKHNRWLGTETFSFTNEGMAVKYWMPIPELPEVNK